MEKGKKQSKVNASRAQAQAISNALQDSSGLAMVDSFEEWLSKEGLTKVGTFVKKVLKKVWDTASSIKDWGKMRDVSNYELWQFIIDNPHKFTLHEINFTNKGLSINDIIAARNERLGLNETINDFNTVNLGRNMGYTDLDKAPLKEKKGEDEYMAERTKEMEHAKSLRNDPKLYESIDLHTPFRIPSGYTKKTVVNGTLATPTIIAHRVAENPVADRSSMIDRYTQKFSLIKATRGLSKTDYSTLDVFNYERLCKLALIEYYSIKRVVQAAKTYSVVQVGIGDSIINACGYDPAEVRANLANYETLLCQFHNFISNNLPMTGTWIKRLQYLKQVFIPDYNDQKVATIHMYTTCISDVYYDVNNPSVYLVFDEIPNSQNNNYSVMLGNLGKIQTALVNNDLWQQIIADYQGAFGTMCVWSDSDYPAYKSPLDLRNGDNDLNREQLKNGFYMDAKLTVITITPGKPNTKNSLESDGLTPIHLPNYQFGQTFDSSTWTGRVFHPGYDKILDHDTYLYAEGKLPRSGDATLKILVPDLNGVGAQTWDISFTAGSDYFISMNNHETIYSMHKDNYTEGESLDISQFKIRSCGVRAGDDGAGSLNTGIVYKTHEYAICDSTAYVFGSNGSAVVAQQYELCNETFSDDALQDVESPVDFPDEIMIWALTDWMPFMHVTFFGYTSATGDYYPRDILLIDMDAFGSLDDRAFSTSIAYSIYSLYGASLRIGKKRVDNINDAYQYKRSNKKA